jgi:hypothetical protein
VRVVSLRNKKNQDDEFVVDDFVFNHPIDMSLACSGLAGWPRFFIELGYIDEFGRDEICALC